MNYSELKNLSLEELRNLNEMVILAIKEKKTSMAFETKSKLHVGANVKVNHKKLMGEELVIEKINRTKAVVRLKNGWGCYNVPLSMIEVVG